VLQAGGHVAQRRRGCERRTGCEQVRVTVDLQAERGADFLAPVVLQRSRATKLNRFCGRAS
jgi:hypothetical protein